jgi:shikimate kinase
MVYLRARPATLLSRIGRVESRPLLRDVAPAEREATLTALLERRRRAYERAAIVVDTDGLTVQGVVDQIVAGLEASR